MKIKLLTGNCSVFLQKKALFFLLMFLSVAVWGQVDMSVTGSYTQDFNTLKTSGAANWVNNSTLENWYAASFNSSYTADNGSSNGGGLKSYGTGTNSDRALGSLGSNNATPSYGVVLKNNSNTTITDIKVSFTGEQWRNGGNTATQQLTFYYAKSSTAINSVAFGAAGYTAVSGLNFSSKINTSSAAALDGNATSNRTVISNVSIPNVNLAAGDYIILKWDDANDNGNDHGLSIDDLSVSWTITPACTGPTLSSTTSAANNTTTGVDLTGSLTAIGGANVTEDGFEHSTSSALASPTKVSNTGLSVSTVPHAINKSVSGLQANTLYYYRAYAINGCTTPQTSYSHTSGFPSFTTLSLAPVSAAPDNILTDSFRANWTAPTGQGTAGFTYHLQIDDDSDFSSPIYNNENETGLSHTQNSLTAGNTYYYRVRIKNAGGFSDWSSDQTITTATSSKPVVDPSTFSGRVNVAFSQNIIATNIPDSYAIVAGSSLPAGLNLNNTTGAITGTPTAAGTFTTNVTATKGAEVSDPVTLTFNISKGNQSISGLATTHANVYGDEPYTLSAVSNSGLVVYYTSSDTSVATVNGNTVTIVGVGTSVITAKQDGDDNWNAAVDVTQTLTVTPKPITITGLTAENKVYDQTTAVQVNGTPEYSGLANGDLFPVTGTVTWAFANKNVGSNKNLVRTGDFDAPSANYTVTQPGLQATITKKDITITSITANNKSYDGNITASFSGVASTDIIDGDIVNYAVTGSFSDKDAGEDKPVTVLSVVLSGTDGNNYNVPLFPTGLTADITKADQTITVTSFPANLTVGSTINLGTYALASSGLALNYSSSTPAVASISSGALLGNNAGTTIITFSQAGDSNYNPAEDVVRTIEVVDLPVPLAQWDFNGYGGPNQLPAVTLAAQNINASLSGSSAILSRGPGAPQSNANNSFRTNGFQNDGIATTNTDYFQTSFTATGNIMSITTINANIYGSSTFVATPGAKVQFAYSLDGSTYQLINSPANITSTNSVTTRIIFNISNVSELQNITPNTTVYFRFYATGQSTGGTLGFSSESSPGTIGLQFDGTFKPSEIIWDGNNWSNFNGPVGSQNVVIDGVYDIAEGFEANNLTITNTGSLTIQPDQGVTINGDITMPDDKLIIESDGSLVQTKITDGNSDNKAIAKRKVNMRTADYTFWSSPLKDQILRNTTNGNADNSTGGFSEGTPNSRTYQYREEDDTFRATADATFVPAKGYAIRGKSTYGADLAADELAFRGNLHNGDISIQVQKSRNTTSNGVTYEHGYNLIGNPYPSNIDFIKFYNLDNNRNVIFGKAWFWSNFIVAPSQQGGSGYTANNYAILSLAGSSPATGIDTENTTGSPMPTEFIKVAQGFIVQMRATPPTGTNKVFETLKFDNSIRANNSGHFYNSKTNSTVDRYWLKMTSPYNIANTILVAHINGATDNYDADYDAELLAIGDDSFYSKLNAMKLQIHARQPLVNNEDVIALGTKHAADGVYKIALGNKEGVFSSTQNVYLKDKLLNKIVNLSEGAYSYQAVKGTDETRFEIVYKDAAVLGSDTVKISDFMVYRDGNSYVVNSTKKLGAVEVYDTAGRLVKSLKTNDSKLRIDVSGLSNGVYILKAENSGDAKTKKILK